MARRKKKHGRPKVNITYPPLSTKKWVPPDQRKKKVMKKPPPYPPQMNTKLQISSLKKVWHAYKVIHNCAVLLGEFSLKHQRFMYTSNGFQGSAMCVIAVLMSKLVESAFWNSSVINAVLIFGDKYYLLSKKLNKRKNFLQVSDLARQLYLFNYKITLNCKGRKFKGLLYPDPDNVEADYLEKSLKEFFDCHNSGVLTVVEPVGRHFAIWKYGNAFFLFDPTDHDEMCWPWSGLPGQGFPICVRFPDIEQIVKVVHRNLPTQNIRFKICPVDIERIILVNTTYPGCVKDNLIKLDTCLPKKNEDELWDVKKLAKTSIKLAKKEELEDELIGVSDKSTSMEKEEAIKEDAIKEEEKPVVAEEVVTEDEQDAETIPVETKPTKKTGYNKKPIIDQPRVESETCFRTILPGKTGILQASTSQDDPLFVTCPSKHGLCNSVAALVMLRQYKAKHWSSIILTNVLRLGYRICIESKRGITPPNLFNLRNVTKKIALEDEVYTPVITDICAAGALGSVDPSIVDLETALIETLSDSDTVIVQGPETVAVWRENGKFYLFDSMGRDANGRPMLTPYNIESSPEAEEPPSGTSCLLWFTEIGDLVEHYMRNLDRTKRKDSFIVSNVEIKDYVELPENWNSFKAVDPDRWILLANISQNDSSFNPPSRNTQSTAMAAVALAYTQLKQIQEWTVNDLDIILKEGDIYYRCCVKKLKKLEKFVSPMLSVAELLKSFALQNKLVTIDVQECYVNGTIEPQREPNKQNLSQAFEEFFIDSDYGILTSCSKSVAVCKTSDSYFYFDSHSHDNRGLSNHSGKACLQRVKAVNTLADCIMANLGPQLQAEPFNVARIAIEIFVQPEFEYDEDDEPDLYYDEIWKPVDEEEAALNDEDVDSELTCGDLFEKFHVEIPPGYYEKLTKKRAILRSNYSQNDGKYETNAGKQTAANLIAALGTAYMFNARDWDVLKLDDVLDKGEEIYESSLEGLYRIRSTKCATPTTELDENMDDVDLSNVFKSFKIGINNITVALDETAQFAGESLRETIVNAFKDINEPNSFKGIILQTKTYDVAVWKNGPLYYLFDPNSRNEKGQIYGWDEWSTVMPMEEHEEEEVVDEEDEEEAVEEEIDYGMPSPYVFEEEIVDYRDDLEEEESVTEEVKVKMGPEYWAEQEKMCGRACVVRFTEPNCLVKHLLNNTPMISRLDEDAFKVTAVKVTNEAFLKSSTASDWYNFKGVVEGQWILRGGMSQDNLLFPENNRGLQADANCLLAIAHASLYDIETFKKETVDAILKYGDRLYTYTKKLRREELQQLQDPPLTNDDVEEILKKEIYTVDKVVKRFCIGDEFMSAKVDDQVLIGEVFAKDFSTGEDLKTMMNQFFAGSDTSYGILTAKNVSVAIWKYQFYYYMFDPFTRGPLGRSFKNGVACITRAAIIEPLAEIFKSNLPDLGNNYFQIYRVVPTLGPCKMDIKVEIRTPADPLKISGFEQVLPGRAMIRGTTNQEGPYFNRGTNAQSAPIALVALAMTLIHNCEYWTKPIIDEIITIGDQIYGELLDRCDFNFNPWEERLTVAMAPADFKIGKIRVNCELRHTIQKGVIDIIDSEILNLRQGFEEFFKENTYGILETDVLTVAVWQSEGEYPNSIYMFDPNPRGNVGEAKQDGVACAMKFCGVKLLTDHLTSLMCDDLVGTFTITPVEIVIERDGKCKKTKFYGLNQKLGALEDKARLWRHGRYTYYLLPDRQMEILRGKKSQNDSCYSVASRGNQDVANCITSYLMDKLIPLCCWTYKTIDMVLDIGDQFYKDSYMIYNPKDKKLHLEALIRDIVIKDIRVKISIGAPIITAKFERRLIHEALDACFNLKSFCILLINSSAVSLFKKDDIFYLFNPTPLNLQGRRVERGNASVLRFKDTRRLVDIIMELFDADDISHDIFHIIVVGVKGIEQVFVGMPFVCTAPLPKVKYPCEKIMYGHFRRNRTCAEEEVEEEESEEENSVRL